LWKVYAGLTLIEIVFLKLNGMSGFEAVCNSLSSISGGGLSPNSQSMIGCSYPLLWITAFFMFFAGVSFNLQYKAWVKLNPLVLFRNEEFRTYFSAIFLACVPFPAPGAPNIIIFITVSLHIAL